MRELLGRIPSAAAAALLICVAGCQAAGNGNAQADPTAAAKTAAAQAPSLLELKNGTYRGFAEPRGSVVLTDGGWEGAPYVQDGAARPAVTFVRDFRLVGDVDGDGSEEAVVLLAQSSGGTGDMLHLAVVGRKDRAPYNIATALVGDRVGVRGARVEGRRIVLDVVQAGERDALCCPGELVTRRWELSRGVLKEAPPEPRGRLTPDVMGGADWVLRAWTAKDAAPPEPAVTLRFEGGRFAGHSGCNRYTAPVEAGKQPGDIALGPVAGTRMMCPEPAMEVEMRFLRNLGGVRRFSFVAGQLALSYELEGSVGAMYFERAATR